jgi:rubrerythrin
MKRLRKYLDSLWSESETENESDDEPGVDLYSCETCGTVVIEPSRENCPQCEQGTLKLTQ